MSRKTSNQKKRVQTFSQKTFILQAFMLACLLSPFQTANAQFFDKVKSLFSGLKNSASTSANKILENDTVQNLSLLGSPDLIEEYKNTFIEKILDERATAFSVKEGLERNSLDQAIAEESMHALDEVSIYTVVKGDTLASIASYFEVTPDTIATFNNLDEGEIETGMVLEIPHISGVLYTVKKNDTLASISKAFKVLPDDIALYNGLVFGANPTEGDEVFLPGATLPKVETKKEDKKSKEKAKIAKNTKVKKTATGSDVNAISKIKKFGGRFGNLPKYDGYYINPAPAARRSQRLHGANGVDLAAPVGTDIFASAPGVVSVARATGWNYGYGQYIVINHPNGTQTVYAHLSSIDVSVGQEVSRGQKIADMGSTGNSTGPHVHFEIRGAFNPFAW